MPPILPALAKRLADDDATGLSQSMGWREEADQPSDGWRPIRPLLAAAGVRSRTLELI
jgi:hypothetical protein